MLKKLLLMSLVFSSLVVHSQDHEIKYDKLVEEVTLVTKEYSNIEDAQKDLDEQLDKFTKKHDGQSIVAGEPESFTRTETSSFQKGVYETTLAGKLRNKDTRRKISKIKFRTILVIDKCYGNKWRWPIKIYWKNSKKKTPTKKKVGTETVTVEKEFHKIEMKVAAFTYEPPKEEPKILYRESEDVTVWKTAWQRSKDNKPSHKPCEEYGFNGPNHKGKTCAVDPEEGGIYVITYDPNAPKPTNSGSGGSNSGGTKTTTKEVSEDGGKTWKIIEQKIEQFENK